METAGNGQNLCQGSSEGRCVVCNMQYSVGYMQHSVGYMQCAIYCNIVSLLRFAQCSLAAQNFEKRRQGPCLQTNTGFDWNWSSFRLFQLSPSGWVNSRAPLELQIYLCIFDKTGGDGWEGE